MYNVAECSHTNDVGSVSISEPGVRDGDSSDPAVSFALDETAAPANTFFKPLKKKKEDSVKASCSE